MHARAHPRDTPTRPAFLDTPRTRAYSRCMSASEVLFRVLFLCTGNTCRSPLAAALLERADLVLLMDPKDRDFVRSLRPEAVERTYGLASFGRPESTQESVPDPYGGSREAYAECLRRIESHLERVVSFIRTALREREVWAKPS